ncbi:MAG: exodeoxyribonuclease VII small subunit [Christensenellaceae bacterium]|nr:exodeoxyribonuclease VII small subunit [Christensenellaceae bacterium]
MDEFEKDLQRLEEITRQLQSGEVGIEKSMELYAEGVKLADMLGKRLNTYKSKSEILEKEVEQS